MDLKHLRYFVAAVEEGSTQAAAQKINVAQPALSRRIRDLEASLGCALLERSVKGVAPTPAGRSLYRDALAILDTVEQAEQRTRRLGFEQRREIRFGLVQAARKYGFLQRALASYAGDHPDAGVALTRGFSRDLATALRERRIDACLLYEQHVEAPHVAERLIHKERYVVSAHPRHRLATPGPIALSDLSGEPLVWMFRRDSGDHHDPLMQACRQHGLEPVIGQWAGSSEEVMDLVTLSAGLCITPASSMLAVSPGQLVFRPLPKFDRELDLSLGWTEMEGLLGRAFLDRVHREIDRHQTLIRAGEEPWMQLDGLRLYRVAEPQTN